MKLLKAALLCLSAAIILLIPDKVKADVEKGTWTVHSTFGYPVGRVIDAGSKVYYVAGHCLFSYDKETLESYSYNTGNKLSDSNVDDIYYNPTEKILVVTYESCNIDIIDKDGNVTNMSDICDASLEPPISINDVTFGNNRIYVATSFGIVEFDATSKEVTQSCLLSTPVQKLISMGEHIVGWISGYLYTFNAGSRIHSLTDLTRLYSCNTPAGLTAIDSNKLLLQYTRSESGQTIYYTVQQTIDFEKKTHADATIDRSTAFKEFSVCPDGRLLYKDGTQLKALSTDGTSVSELTTLPQEFAFASVSTYRGPEELWSLTREGLACHDFSTETPTILTQRFRPEQLSTHEVIFLKPSQDGKTLFAYNQGYSPFRGTSTSLGDAYITPTIASAINLETGNITDITPYPVESTSPKTANARNNLGQYLFSPTCMAADLTEDGTYYFGSVSDGICKVKNGSVEGYYRDDNSPLRLVDQRNILYGLSVDHGGNLWFSTTPDQEYKNPVYILPKEKLTLKPSDVKKSDWYWLPSHTIGYTGGHDVQYLHCNQSHLILFADHGPSTVFVAVNTQGTFNDFSDDKLIRCKELVDQDGNICTPSRKCAFFEDNNGAIWMGTSEGVYIIPNPINVDVSTKVRRVKVPKDDGSDLADYLLSSDMVLSISADVSNRKWLATKDSGLFLVSPDGSRILKNFTTDNSPLASNTVYSVYCDRATNTVYIGTGEGLFSYKSESIPATESFDDITVFPNPVRPEYSGPIYIKGLMENSLVKIADAAGNIIYQTRSESGLVSWNGCNASGRPVPSGVYYIFASQNSSGSTIEGTAKFMIIR